MKDVFNIIYNMIEKYEEATDEKPYVILIQPETCITLIKEQEKTNAWRYLEKKHKTDFSKLNYLFGVPIEISKYIIQPAIAMNENYYKKYCEYRFTQDCLESKGE